MNNSVMKDLSLFRRGVSVSVYEGASVATAVSILLIFLFRIFKFRFFASPSPSIPDSVSLAQIQSRTRRVVSDDDLKWLIQNLEESNEVWEHVIHKTNDRVSYSAKRCKPTDGGPMKYLSVTVFEDCSAEMLKDFYMDNDFRKQWDKTVVDHHQLQVDSSTGIEIGRTLKKFPLLTSREYVLAWKLWHGNNDSFYCFTKECDHDMVPRQRKYVRVSHFRSGWRIRRVPGRNACEIKMFHQENAGLNVEMAKLAFSKGIWSYVSKMDNAFRNYVAISHTPQGSVLSALTLIAKVPSELESQTVDVTASMGGEEILTRVAKQKKLLRKPSKKLIAKGLVLVGGAICLSRGHSALGAKVALAYLLTKLNKRATPLKQTTHNTSI
ncbi:unnamed protein product [Brassica rapa]|uniref:BnaA06g00040D protein n=2 Tax=Brassica TaxID=3705 RepID=A0A078ITY4_BRANA|nr:unnamed protein product [Brassica rapa]CDY52914.1 BnaA06g00040D [Brassica napus]VDD24395.1 unnamed protein product [Brassica rapa]